MQDKDFLINNQRISKKIFYPPSKKEKYPTILFVHGWTSEKERSYQYADSLSSLGYLCFLFDLRGHGQSEGDMKKLTSKDFLDDVVAAYDYLLTNKQVDKENISVVGSSLGAYLVAILSRKRKIKNLVLRAPADYPNEDFTKFRVLSGGSNPYVMSWRKKEKQPSETFALEAIHSFEGNILILESEYDDRIPHETTQNYMNAVKDKSKLTHILMKGAPHSLKEGKFRDGVENLLVDWFKPRI